MRLSDRFLMLLRVPKWVLASAAVPLIGLFLIKGSREASSSAYSSKVSSFVADAPLQTMDTLGVSEQPAFSRAQSVEKTAASVAEKKVVYSASVELEVEKYETSYDEILKAVRAAGAELVNSTSRHVEGQGSEGRLTLLVEPSRLETLLNEIGQCGNIRNRQVQSDDRTAAYIDLKARLDNAQHVRVRLIQVLKTQTGKLSEILEVEREIGRVGETIESLEGQIRYLNSQVRRSQVDVTLREPGYAIVPIKGSMWVDLRSGLHQAWNTFFSTAVGILSAVGFLLAIALYIGIASGIYLFIRRKRMAQ